jgi:hypothetical protein
VGAVLPVAERSPLGIDGIALLAGVLIQGQYGDTIPTSRWTGSCKGGTGGCEKIVLATLIMANANDSYNYS